VENRKLESVNGFLLRDLPDAEFSVGPVRLGVKLIASNATNYARELSYVFASLGQRRGGMTIGLKVDAEHRDSAVAALGEELAQEFGAGQLLVDPGLRMAAEDVSPLAVGDSRNPILNDVTAGGLFSVELNALGAAVVADKVVGLAGRSVAIEGLAGIGVAIAREVELLGGAVKRVSTSKGSVSGDLTAVDLAAAVSQHGAEAPSVLGEVDKPWSVWRSSGVDLIFCGSAPGALSAAGAPSVGTTPVVTTGVAPVATKALAMLKAEGAEVAPAFLAALGVQAVAFDPSITTHEAARARTVDVVAGVCDELSGSPHGMFIGACMRAEAFMKTWAEELPFGRPLA
jgi:hypothetical protein